MVDFAPRFRHLGRLFCPMTLVRMVRRSWGSPLVRVRIRPATDYGSWRRWSDALPLGGARELGYDQRVMRCRRVTVLVAIYLALDFANPMMPGAVQLVGGSLETVAGCQARSAEAPAPASTMVPRDLSTVAPQREPTLRSPGRVVLTFSPVPLLFRAPLAPRSTPASSSDDD